MAKINEYHVSLFGYLLEKLKTTPDGDGSLLDHSMYMYGSGMGDPNLHDHINLPILVAGGGAGRLKGGRHIRYADRTPLANLHLTLLEKAGVRMDSFADSKGEDRGVAIDLIPSRKQGRDAMVLYIAWSHESSRAARGSKRLLRLRPPAPSQLRLRSRGLRLCGFTVALLSVISLAGAADSSLADAAQTMDQQSVRALIEKSVDVNATQVDGMTALHWACRHDDLEMAKLLVETGADVNTTNRYGVTPLTLACTNGNGALVKLLLDAGADPNTSLPGGETALMTASRTGRIGPVKALLASGADLYGKVHGMGRREGAGATAFLIRMSDPTIFDFETKPEQTALIWAVAEGHAEVVAELIKAGADSQATLSSWVHTVALRGKERPHGSREDPRERGRRCQQTHRASPGLAPWRLRRAATARCHCPARGS